MRPELMYMPPHIKESIVRNSGSGRIALSLTCREFSEISDRFPYNFKNVSISADREKYVVDVTYQGERLEMHNGDRESTIAFFTRLNNESNTIDRLSIESTEFIDNFDDVIAELFWEIEFGKLSVKVLRVRDYIDQEMLRNVMLKLRPGFLEEIHLVNIVSDDAVCLDLIKNLPQWRQAKRFSLLCGITTLDPIDYAHFQVMGRFGEGVGVRKLRTMEVGLLLTHYGHMTCDRSIILDKQKNDVTLIKRKTGFDPYVEHRIHQSLYFVYNEEELRFHNRQLGLRLDQVVSAEDLAAQQREREMEEAQRLRRQERGQNRIREEEANARREESQRVGPRRRRIVARVRYHP